jgi:tripartite-type tricarboxylate transporter receptor subunit TctC
MRIASSITILIALHAGSVAAAEPAYPVKPIRFIVANAPGGTSDILARLIGPKLSDTWKQQVVVENRAGGSGLIGIETVAKAAPDGYTYLVADLGSTTITALTHGKGTVDLPRDFAPVTIISYSPHLFCVHPSVPVNSVRQLISLARAQPSKLNFATAGATSAPQFAAMLFAQRTGIDWVYIPGKGGAQAVFDVMSGQADVLFNGMLATLPHVRSGKLKVIAVTSAKRNAALAETPTVSESGVPDFVTGSWQGILAPAKIPPDVLSRMHAETSRALLTPEMKERLSGQGADAVASSPSETAEFMRRERDRWSKLIRDTNFKVN